MVALQIRDVPTDWRDALAAEADANDESLQTLLHEVIRLEAMKAKNRAWLRKRDAEGALVAGPVDMAEIIRAERGESTISPATPQSRTGAAG